AEKYATTFLWQGAETYCDVHSANRKTGPHNRCWIFDRGLPVGEDGLLHLAEDHGVCLSSSLDFFGDDLIFQAFGRSLILAPEIYANPWLLRDDEYPLLARIYNLHRKAAPILVDGFPLPESYGPSAVARGSASHRFVVLGNGTWNEKTVRLSFRECGYAGAVPSVRLIRRYPTETVLGDYPADGAAEVTLRPFRAYLFEIAPKEEAFPVLENSEYTVVREAEDGTPKEIRRETIPGAPVLLGSMIPAEVPQAEGLLEAARFGVDNDSLEARSLRRSGPSSVPEVNACRDAFFSQHTYLSRGPEGRFAFDGRNDTFFDGLSRTFPDSLRVMGGCLRVDAGEILDCDTVEIDCFDPDTPVGDCFAAQIPEKGEYSEGLDCWKDSEAAAVSVKNASFTAPVIRFGYDISTTAPGRILTVSYRVGPLRRFRLKEPMDRIYAIRLLKNGKELPLTNPFVNNLMPHPSVQSPVSVHKIELTLPKISEGDWLAVAAEGVHGWESAWCVADFGSGEPVGFPARAPAYPANVWEARVRQTDANYTFYLPLKKEDSGK
ncbi:MAG: hypothetical protein II719_01070, partial [Clostridia bacterium]|nr:hypothetical protein [Clostridia bacterium]